MKSRVLALLGALALVTAAACAESTTAPVPHAGRAARDTTIIQGDTLLCRSGYTVEGGKYVCNNM